MRKLLYIIGCIIMFASCNDNNEQILPDQKEFEVGQYNQISIGANVVVINNAQASGTNTGRTTGTSHSSIITVKGQPELVAYISIEAIDGIVYIRTSNEIALEDSITVELNTIDLATIKLEADQHATVHWEAEEFLSTSYNPIHIEPL